MKSYMKRPYVKYTVEEAWNMFPELREFYTFEELLDNCKEIREYIYDGEHWLEGVDGLGRSEILVEFI